jgi:RNA polymerase sigma-70 factor (ECF subfamily)
MRNQEEAEDIVQETFLKLWNMKDKLGEYRSIEALATTMTRNSCIDSLRKNKTEYREDIELNRYSSLTVPSPHEKMVMRESDSIIRAIIEKMPESSKSLIKFHDLDGKSYEEIAEVTGQNINTIRVNISRARKFIRDEFNRYQDE